MSNSGSNRTEGEPHLQDLVRELRRAVGLFDGAMPITPKQAWEEALEVVANLRKGYCARCVEKDYPTAWETALIDGSGGDDA